MLVNFGLRVAEGDIAFLMQESPPQTVLPVEVPCPFVLNRRDALFARCPHNVDLRSRVDAPAEILNDQLCQVLAPVPTMPGAPNVYLLQDNDERDFTHLVRTLYRLGSPTGYNDIAAVWEHTSAKLAAMRQLTNLGALVIYGMKLTDMPKVIKLVEGNGRRALLVSYERLPRERDVQTVTTKLGPWTLPTLRWEAIGAGMLWRHMAGGRVLARESTC